MSSPAYPPTSTAHTPTPPRTLPRSVFLIGAQATGKTELFEALRLEFPGSPAVEEVARREMKARGWTGETTGLEGRQTVLFERSAEEEDKAANRAARAQSGEGDDSAPERAILSDRSSLCALVYAKLSSTTAQYNHLINLLHSSQCAPALARYRSALVVLLEPVDPSWYVDDGVRGAVNEQGWERIRTTYRDVLGEVQVEYVVLRKEVVDLGARVEWVKALLGPAGEE